MATESATKIDSTRVAWTLLASVTCSVNVLVPVAAGVPVMAPVDWSRVSPAGRVPLDTVQV